MACQTARFAAIVPSDRSTQTATYGRWYSATFIFGTSMVSSSSAANSGRHARPINAAISHARMHTPSMNQQQTEQQRHDQTDSDERPRGRALAGMNLE